MPYAANKLAHISGSTGSHKAVIVVGGIHDTYKHFASWEKDLGKDGALVVGFDHNHQSSTMTASGKELADSIRELKAQGIDDITIVAHSMGGLVSKAAINDLAQTGDAQNFEKIDFHALGTPWGGFAVSSLPFTETLAPLVGYPMGGEMAPNSEFMQKLSAQELPDNVHISIYQGLGDSVSIPGSQWTADRYNANLAQADAYITIEGYGHTDYRNAGPDILRAGQGIEPSGFEAIDERVATAASAEPSHQNDASQAAAYQGESSNTAAAIASFAPDTLYAAHDPTAAAAQQDNEVSSLRVFLEESQGPRSSAWDLATSGASYESIVRDTSFDTGLSAPSPATQQERHGSSEQESSSRHAQAEMDMDFE